ncbi:glycosyltransferase [Polaribacter sp. MSW13]|uniref:Glycosyltransferase n=1 Tax=Polaribacter marinus TaxID=2916838 RepID=A0A9X1VMP0_9FLAO|nr:glycosyltransferase [Polaribacter marinus]MCI2228951.1 glycosyltransferase [Polaribacter marinus]
MIGLLIFIFTLYTILIVSLAIGFLKVEEFKTKKKTETTSFSIVIPFRNEAKNLPNLLNSIAALNYPKELVEFLFVDDTSSDNSVEIINSFVISNQERGEISKVDTNLDYEILPIVRMTIRIIKNIRKSNSPKKDAITAAISVAKNNWIVTTDADCNFPKNWLKVLDSFIQQKDPKMVVAPVNYKVQNNFLEQFQLLDFMSLQGTTIGGFGIDFPFMCNGANLAYQKESFLQLNGFEGNNTIASGDDIFLFEKFIESNHNSVHFLKATAAIVTTFPVKTWIDLINQRTRWAAKTSNFKSVKVKLIGLLVLTTNLFLITSFFTLSLKIALICFALKMLIDLFLFLPTIRFFNHQNNFTQWYLLSSLLYPFFSVFIVFNSLFSKYNWKGRRFKK